MGELWLVPGYHIFFCDSDFGSLPRNGLFVKTWWIMNDYLLPKGNPHLAVKLRLWPSRHFKITCPSNDYPCPIPSMLLSQWGLILSCWYQALAGAWVELCEMNCLLRQLSASVIINNTSQWQCIFEGVAPFNSGVRPTSFCGLMHEKHENSNVETAEGFIG